MANRCRAPPDQPRNPDGPRQPRSTTPAERSYDSRASSEPAPDGISNGTSRYGDAARSSGVSRRSTRMAADGVLGYARSDQFLGRGVEQQRPIRPRDRPAAGSDL